MTAKTAQTPTTAPESPEPTPDGAMIGAHQLRALSAALRDHGITTDSAVYDYLTAATGREIASRKELGTVEAAHLIRDLIDNPPRLASPDRLAALRAEFPSEAVGKLPRSTCRDCSKAQNKRCDRHTWIARCPVCQGNHSSASIHLDFVGHADVTARLLEVDPHWTWRPFTAEEIAGIPPTLRNGLWIWLTVLGIERPGFGDEEGGKGAKEAIGDAIRNAAMRHGVALSLWAKGDRDWAHSEKTDTGEPAPTPQQPTQSTARDDLDGMATAELLNLVDELATKAGVEYAQFTEKFRTEHGLLSVADLDALEPAQLIPWVRNVRAYIEKTTTPPA